EVSGACPCARPGQSHGRGDPRRTALPDAPAVLPAPPPRVVQWLLLVQSRRSASSLPYSRGSWLPAWGHRRAERPGPRAGGGDSQETGPGEDTGSPAPATL